MPVRPTLARRHLVVAGLLCTFASVHAGPPEGKGPPHKEHGGKGGGSRDKGESMHERRGGRADDRRGGGPGGGGGSVGGGGGGTLVTAGISISTARQIAVDVGIRPGAYQPLPPGIRKNLARGKPVPPGIAKKMAPPAMVARLPSYPGYEWRIVGTDLVLVAVATLIIADVLFDIF